MASVGEKEAFGSPDRVTVFWWLTLEKAVPGVVCWWAMVTACVLVARFREKDVLDQQRRTCLFCSSYHKLLRVPRRCFYWASVFLSLPCSLRRSICIFMLLVNANVFFVTSLLRGVTTPLIDY